MSRPKRMISEEEALRLLPQGEYGVLSMITPEGQPYAVPVNYVYLPEERALIFHCSKTGRKADCLRTNPRISFTAVINAQVVPERYTTHYESVLLTGSAAFLTDGAEIETALRLIADRFSPGDSRREEVITHFLPAVAVCRITVDTVTGKRNEDL